MSMIRKQLYIPKELDQRLAIAAKQQGKPEAQIVREAIKEKLDNSSTRTAGEALLRLAELGKKLNIRLPADASTNHDDYLYGDKK